MSDILFQYQRISPTTWVYVSSLMTIGLFFKFGRVWSVRNLDLLLLIALAPGLLMVVQGQSMQRSPPEEVAAPDPPPRDGTPDPAPDGQGDPNPLVTTPVVYLGLEIEEFDPPETETDSGSGTADGEVVPLVDDDSLTDAADLIGSGPPPSLHSAAEQLPPHVRTGQAIETSGYLWLFAVGLLLLVRLLVDPNMVRRPLLEPNLSTGGMVFLGCALLVFLMANVITGTPSEDDLVGPTSAENFMAGREAGAMTGHGPGLPMLYMLPTITTSALVAPPQDLTEPQQIHFSRVVTAKTMAILSHLAIVIGMVMIGYWHFDNIKMGVGAATLYLILPYMAEMTGRVDHALPGALLVWAIAAYRRPLVAGMLLGLAAGIIYYPLYLLPLWISFYWQRGLGRMLAGVVAVIALMAFSMIFNSDGLMSYWLQIQSTFGLYSPKMEELEGIWRVAWDPAYRMPIIAAFIALAGTFALWPPRKNFGTLLSCSAAVMLAVQYWTGYFGGGGTIMAWYLPLLLLTVFRPNLEDRVAIAVLDKGRWPRLAALDKAA